MSKSYIKVYKFAVILFITILIATFCLIFGKPSYETNDDAIINLISAGAYGEPSQYLVYSGILFGYFLKFAYSFFPDINCYLWTYIISNVLSISIIVWVLTGKMRFITTVFTSVLFNILIAKEFFISIQYTKNAALYTMAGFALISYLIKEKKRNALIIVASLLLALGLSARKESFLLVIPFAIVILAYVLLTEENIDLKTLFINIGIPAMFCIVVIISNYLAFNLNEEWNYYYQWNSIMTDRRDHGNYNFSWNEEEYLDAGFTEWDFRMLDEWTWNDTDYFNLDKLKLMAEIGKDTKVSNIRFEKELLVNTAQTLFETKEKSVFPIILMIGILIVCFFAFVFKNSLLFWVNLAVVFITFLEEYYLVCTHRIEWRAEYCILLSAFVFGALLASYALSPKISEILKIRFLSPALLIATIICTLCWGNTYLDFESNSFKTNNTSGDNVFEKINSTDGFFVLSIDDMYGGLCGARNLYDIDRKYADWYSNISPIGGWIIPSPIGLYSAHKNGISNVMKALVDNDNVYYVGGGEHMGFIYVYLNEKYGPGIEVKDVEFDGFNAWDFFYTNQ